MTILPSVPIPYFLARRRSGLDNLQVYQYTRVESSIFHGELTLDKLIFVKPGAKKPRPSPDA